MKRSDDQDAIESLRALWSEVEPPSPSDGTTDELHQAAVEWLDSALDAAAQEAGSATQALDADTTAAIAWVRSAWSQVQIPALPSSPAARTLHLRPARKRLRHHTAAAAAALLIAGLAFTLAPLSRQKITPPPTNPTLIARAPEPPTTPPTTPPLGPASIPVRIVPAGLELTSGPVRLTLLAQLTPIAKTQD